MVANEAEHGLVYGMPKNGQSAINIHNLHGRSLDSKKLN